MWFYKEKEFTTSMIGEYVGFVYEIYDSTSKKTYIGQKRFWRKITRPPLKGKKRKRKSIVESAWKEYYGSNKEINLLVESGDSDRFHRKIIYLCDTFAEMNYLEAKLQFDRNVLLRDDYYNGIIQCRISQSQLKKVKSKLEII